MAERLDFALCFIPPPPVFSISSLWASWLGTTPNRPPFTLSASQKPHGNHISSPRGIKSPRSKRRLVLLPLSMALGGLGAAMFSSSSPLWSIHMALRKVDIQSMFFASMIVIVLVVLGEPYLPHFHLSSLIFIFSFPPYLVNRTRILHQLISQTLLKPPSGLTSPSSPLGSISDDSMTTMQKIQTTTKSTVFITP